MDNRKDKKINQSRNSNIMRKARSRKWWERKYMRNTRKCPWGEEYAFSGWKNLFSTMDKKMDLCQSTSPWDFRNLRIMKRIPKASRYRGTNINSLKIIWNQNDTRILNISHWHWKILGKCINIKVVTILAQNSIPSQSIHQVQRQNKNIFTYASFPKRYPSMHHPSSWYSRRMNFINQGYKAKINSISNPASKKSIRKRRHWIKLRLIAV